MRVLRLSKAGVQLMHIKTKFGGAPAWRGDPQWPLSRSTGKPMRFIGQIELPEGRFGEQELAYVFMTDPDPRHEEYVDGTWIPDGGENAVIMQPAPFTPVVETADLTFGPTMQQSGVRRGRWYDRIFGLKAGPFREDVQLSAVEVEVPDEEDAIGTRLFCDPVWLQGDETPEGDWSLIVQIDSCTEGIDVNFGDAGVGYAFARNDGSEARFLWQCC